MGPMQKLTVLLTLFWLSVLTVGWTVVLALPTGWARKASLFYAIDMGLYQAEVSEGTGARIMRSFSGSAGPQAQEKLKAMKYGTFTLHDHATMWCQLHLEVIGVNACFLASVAMYTSWAMLLFGGVGLINLISGGLMLYVYAFQEAHAWMRKFMKGAFLIAFFLFFCGTTQYMYLIEVLKEFPPASEGTSASFTAIAALVLTGLTLIPVGVAFFLEPSEDEFRNDLEDERRHFERDEKLMGLYGSVEAEKLDMGGQPQGPPAPGMGQPGPAGYPAPGMAPPGPGMGAASSSSWSPGYGEPAFGGPAPSGQPPAYGGPPPAYGGQPPAYGGPAPGAYGGQPPAYGGPPQ